MQDIVFVFIQRGVLFFVAPHKCKKKQAKQKENRCNFHPRKDGDYSGFRFSEERCQTAFLQFTESLLISEIQIFEERKPNGQWLKSIKFKLPIIEEDMEISLDNDAQVETVALLERI